MMTRTAGAGACGSGWGKISRAVKPWLFLLPMLLLAALFVYYPFLKNIVYSFSTVNRFGKITAFAGLDNYRYMFSRREFGTALRNTLTLTGVNVPVTLLITLLAARLRRGESRMGLIPDALLSLPMAVSMSAASLIFRVLLNPTVGYINALFGMEYPWFESARTALPSLLTLTVWMGIPFNFLILRAAFRNVPGDVIEGARLDGAGTLRIFFRMELPLVMPTVLYVICTNTILALMTSGPVMIITRGGPSRATTTLIYLMYTAGYGSFNFSMAACVSLAAFVLSIAFTLLNLWLDREKVSW